MSATNVHVPKMYKNGCGGDSVSSAKTSIKMFLVIAKNCQRIQLQDLPHHRNLSFNLSSGACQNKSTAITTPPSVVSLKIMSNLCLHEGPK